MANKSKSHKIRAMIIQADAVVAQETTVED